MNRIFSHLLIVAFAATTVFAQDTIVLKNGDVLTGKILKQDRLHVYFKSPAFGAVSLGAADISEIHIAIPETGTIAIPQDPAPVQPTPAVTPKTVARKITRKKATILHSERKPKKRKWTGRAGLEVAMREKNTTRLSSGNVIGKNESYETYRVYGNLKWKGKRNSLTWNCTYRYSQDETRTRDDYFNITQKYKHNFEKGIYYAEAKTVYQNDYNRQIDNEYLQTAEIGRKWFNQPSLSFSTSFGGGYHQFDRTISGEVTRTKEPKFIVDQSIRWKMINSLTLFQKYTHLGDMEAYHFVFTAGLENKLIQDVFLRLEYRLDRDTEVSYDDKGYYDKALRTSLLYKF